MVRVKRVWRLLGERIKNVWSFQLNINWKLGNGVVDGVVYGFWVWSELGSEGRLRESRKRMSGRRKGKREKQNGEMKWLWGTSIHILLSLCPGQAHVVHSQPISLPTLTILCAHAPIVCFLWLLISTFHHA